MSRAAGNERFYEFGLNNNPKLPSIKLTSVTTIIHDIFGANQHIVDWAANNFKDADEMRAYRNKRAEEGTNAHGYAERWIAAAEGSKPAPQTGFDEAWLRYVGEHQPVFTHSETIVYSLKHAYAGTLDLGLLDVGGTVRIVDIKTKGKRIYKAYQTELIQCRLYAMAAYEMGLIDRPDGPTGVIILKENGRYTWDDNEVSVDVCEAMLNLHAKLYGRRA